MPTPSKKTEQYMKTRVEEISKLIYEVAAGNFDYKLELTDLEGELEGLIGGINMLGEELKASTVSRDFMESIYRGVVDILIILNPDHTIQRLNDAVIDHLGYLPSELIGRNFNTLISESDFYFLEEINTNLEASGAYHNAELSLLRKDGMVLETSASFSSLFDNQKNHLGTIIIAKDITQIKETERELKSAKLRAEAASEAKSNFLANMSHEIRTPLNGMLGFLELLSYSPLDETQSGYLDMIKTSGQSLAKLLNDILDLSKVENRKLNIEKIPFNLEGAIRSGVMTHRYLAEEKGLKFHLEFARDIPKNVSGDPSRLTQIITNLVGNALKFTEEGSVTLKVSCTHSDQGAIQLHVAVLDTGIGIPDKIKSSLFQSFSQGDNSSTRRYGGAGLGLAISKHLVQLMEGTIDFESPPISMGSSKGTCFRVDLPIEIATDLPLGESISRRRPGSFPDGFRILLVEDNEINIMLAQKILQKLNAEVVLARNGKQAIDMAADQSFDVILMDIQMPVLDGFEASQALRKSGYNDPIIALSANVYNEEIKKCYESGMNGHIGKPFTIAEIYNKIASVLGIKQHDGA